MVGLNNSKLLLELFDNIQSYRMSKSSNSTNSMGMFFETKSNTYFLDTATGKVISAGHHYMEFLKAILEIDNFEKLCNTINLSEDEISEICNYIKDEDLLKGTTGNALYNDETIAKCHEELSSKCQQLILEVTGECNLRCRYCIFGSEEKRFRDFNTKVMSEETILRSLEYMRQHGDNPTYITFYGGEPLVAFERIKFTIDKALEIFKDRQVYFSFTSNFTLMTKEKAKYFAGIPNLSILCSLDGPEDIHNAYRVSAGKKGTFKEVMKGLNTLYDAIKGTENEDMSINFNCVYAPPYSVEKLDIIDSFFKELLIDKPNGEYSITYTTEDTLPKEVIEKYEMRDFSLIEWISEILLSSEKIEDQKCKSIVDYIMPVHDRALTEMASTVITMNGCCVPGARRLYVDTDGIFRVCERINKAPAIGDLEKGVDKSIILEKYYKEYSEHSIKYCSDCWAVKMCPMCYADRMTEAGISRKAHRNCADYRNSIRKKFSLYHQILETNPEKLSCLNEYIRG